MDKFSINSLSELGEKIVDFFTAIIDMISSVLEALSTFYDMLEEFDSKIVNMASSCGTSEFEGLPVKEAIGTFRYLVGDVVFYIIYMIVLVGCLFTIYKLVVLLFDAVHALIEQVSGVNCKNLFTNLVSKFFK